MYATIQQDDNKSDDDVDSDDSKKYHMEVMVEDISSSNCSKCKIFYDILTIFISIADITTDIMILISFYNSNKMTFFWISLSILIIAQIGYTAAFLLSFEFDDFIERIRCKCCESIYWDQHPTYNIVIACIIGLLVFICLMPFGHLVSFLLYFGENEDSKFTKWLNNTCGIKKTTNIHLGDEMSEMAQFTANKINKHSGFILETILEALPQSILQLCAMVYYNETNYIAIISILLSMTSFMTKSLSMSQGINWNHFFFNWICVNTDFFSIFFVVSWIFSDNEYVVNSIIPELWFWKVTISILLPFIFIIVYYLLILQWYPVYELWNMSDTSIYVRVYLIIMFLIFGNALMLIGFGIGMVISCFILEIVCFDFIVVFIMTFLTIFRWDYFDTNVSKLIKRLLSFISNSSSKDNNKIIRILSVNYAYYKCNLARKYKDKEQLKKFIIRRKNNNTLHEVSYNDIRDNSYKPQEAHLFSGGMKYYLSVFSIYIHECKQEYNTTNDKCQAVWMFILGFGGILLFYISLPIYLFGRIFTIIYPYFIVFYLFYYNLYFKMNLFELTMLGIYILLQITIFILSFFVFRTHFYLWHIVPGLDYVFNENVNINSFFKNVYEFYHSVQWLPITKEILLSKFGANIGHIIFDYLLTLNDDE